MIGGSPGLYTREIDLSNYTPEIGTSICGMIGTASKGPTDEVVLITDEGSLISVFGEPSTEHLALYAAIAYLRRGRQLKFIRVANYDLIADGDLKTLAGVVTGSIVAVSSGSWGNLISVVIAAGADSNTYKITVKKDGVTEETYDRLKVGSGNTGDSNYILTRINGISEYISISLSSVPTDLTLETITLVGGDDGIPVDNADYIGSAGDPPTVPATGMQLFANVEYENIDILCTPGVTESAVFAAGIVLCEARGDCIFIVDPPQNKTVTGVAAWSNGTGGGAGEPSAAINSSYAALYWPWVKVYDGYSDANVWVPPSGFAAAVMAYTDYINEIWGAPAGESRGIIREALELEHSPTLGERDYLYTNGNIVNPIVNFPARGIMIWGQRTTQRASTALDRINVRRLLLYLKRAIREGVRGLVFEPNDSDTWIRLKNIVNPLLADVSARNGLDNYNVVCDETTNTPTVINRNEMLAKIFLEPTKTAEVVMLDFVVLASGDSFITES